MNSTPQRRARVFLAVHALLTLVAASGCTSQAPAGDPSQTIAVPMSSAAAGDPLPSWNNGASKKEFPPRQKPASFSIDQALEKARERQQTMAAAGAAPAVAPLLQGEPVAV